LQPVLHLEPHGTHDASAQKPRRRLPPEDLVAIAPLLFSRIGALEQKHQERFIQEVQRDPQAKRVFEKMQSFTH